MPINLTTVYTKERLLQFNHFVWASKKLFWIFMALCTFFIVGAYVFILSLESDPSTICTCLIMIIAIDVTYLACAFIVPRFAVGKAKNLNTTIHYSFDTDCFHIQAVNAHATETATIQYSMLTKIAKKHSNLYLFFSRQQAYVADLSTLSAEQEALLMHTLHEKVSTKKFNWTT